MSRAQIERATASIAGRASPSARRSSAAGRSCPLSKQPADAGRGALDARRHASSCSSSRARARPPRVREGPSGRTACRRAATVDRGPGRRVELRPRSAERRMRGATLVTLGRSPCGPTPPPAWPCRCCATSGRHSEARHPPSASTACLSRGHEVERGFSPVRVPGPRLRRPAPRAFRRPRYFVPAVLISASTSSTSLGTAALRITGPLLGDEHGVLDPDVQVLVGDLHDRLDGDDHAGAERLLRDADVVHAHADEVTGRRRPLVAEAPLLEDLPCRSSRVCARVAPGTIAAMIAFCASSAHWYALSWSSSKRPDTGHVRVMSMTW